MLGVAAGLATIHFLLPVSLQNALAFDHSQFNVYSLWTAAFVHADNLHLVTNLGGFVVAMTVLWLLYDHLDQQATLRRSLAIFVVVFPIPISLFSYYVYQFHYNATEAVTRGFSGVVASLFAFLFASLIAYGWRRWRWQKAVGLGTLVLLPSMLLILETANMLTPVVGVLGVAVIASSSYLLVPTDRVDGSLLRPWKFDGREDEFLIVLASILVLVVAISSLFPIDWIGQDSVKNVFSHFAGFALGFLYGGVLWMWKDLIPEKLDGVDSKRVENLVGIKD